MSNINETRLSPWLRATILAALIADPDYAGETEDATPEEWQNAIVTTGSLDDDALLRQFLSQTNDVIERLHKEATA